MDELYIGLMSGTSLNGIDAVLLGMDAQSTKLLHTHSEAFPPQLHDDLQQLIKTQQTSLQRLAGIDHQLAVLYSLTVKKLLHESGINAGLIRAIGCHGQTIYHQPEGEHPNSLQLGDPSFIAEATGITVIADLRRRDIAAGGQGAPLVPAFHAAMFHSTEAYRVIVNIGGIANITLLPPAADTAVSGFDTGPGNTLMDLWIQQQRQQEFDFNGEWAAGGAVRDTLLHRMLAEEYFQRKPPKSSGRELFNLHWLNHMLGTNSYPPQDVQATLLELTCRSITDAILKYAPDVQEVYVCGGGARNKRLLQSLSELLDKCRVSTTAELGVEPEWVEAAAFAWLARQTLNGLAGNLTSVTGAARSVVLGGIFPGKV